MLPVRFGDLQALLWERCGEGAADVSGLWLSVEDARNLIINIQRMRAYQLELVDLLELYRAGSRRED